MALVPLFGHEPLRARLADAVARGALPASLLLEGPRGVGKQRLALWLAQLLLCGGEGAARPCGACQHCRYVEALAHPDLHWYFPRPRLKDADPDLADVVEDFREATAERAKGHGLYAPPTGLEGVYVATIRALVQQAAMTPALGKRKVFIVGDADRMVSQEGADQAANAFLKLLEEPPADTTVILTSSESGALLPTIRSRVVGVRVPRLADADVEAFANHPLVADAVGAQGTRAERVRAASGAPGALLAGSAWSDSMDAARQLLDAAISGERAAAYATALRQGVAKARGSYSDALDALTVLLHERVRVAAERGDERRAADAALAVELVEEGKEMAQGNVSPNLATARLLRRMGELLR
jgi:DNA polymerase-3 subunit delta'